MSVNVNPADQANNYYVNPKKTKTGRLLTTSLGLAGSAVATGFLLNEQKSPFNPEVIAAKAQASGIDFVDKQSSLLKNLKFQRYLPLALGTAAVLLLSYGLGAAIDNGINNRRIKNAQKRAFEQQREIEMIKQNVDVKV